MRILRRFAQSFSRDIYVYLRNIGWKTRSSECDSFTMKKVFDLIFISNFTSYILYNFISISSKIEQLYDHIIFKNKSL